MSTVQLRSLPSDAVSPTISTVSPTGSTVTSSGSLATQSSGGVHGFVRATAERPPLPDGVGAALTHWPWLAGGSAATVGATVTPAARTRLAQSKAFFIMATPLVSCTRPSPHRTGGQSRDA